MLSSLLQKAGLRPGLALHSTIPKVLMAAVILGGAGSMLSAGSAQAALLTWSEVFADSSGLCNNLASLDPRCTVGDKTMSNFTTNYTLIAPPPEASATNTSTVQLSELNGIWDIDFDFLPGQFADTSQTYSLSYDIEITDPSKMFATASVGALCNQANVGPCTVRKQIAYYINNILQPIDASLTMVAVNSNAAGPVAIAAGITKMRIYDSWSVQFPGSLDGISNNFTQSDVPGPLPLMGAGMAFGFSRKLRSRIKASASAKV